MSLQNVKILTGVDDERIQVIYDRTESRLLKRLQQSLPDKLTIPDELEYVVEEVTIARFNRLGSEGMVSESMDGHSATYESSDFQAFERDIVDYINAQDVSPKKGVVRFI